MLGGDGRCVSTHVDVRDRLGPEAQLRQLRDHVWHHRADGRNISDAHLHSLQHRGWLRQGDSLALHDKRLHRRDEAAGWSVWVVAAERCDVELWVHADPVELGRERNSIRLAWNLDL